MSTLTRQRGYTIIETLVSLCIFGMVSVGIAGGMTSYMRFNTVNEQKSGAIMAAQVVLDDLRMTDPVTLPSTGETSESVQVGNRSYLVTTSYCSSSEFCTSNNLRHLRLRVTYRDAELYNVETVYAQLR